MPLIVCIVFGAIAAVVFLQRVYVTCSRSTGECTYGAMGLISERHTIPLSTIGSLDVVRARGGLSRLEFETDSVRAPVTSTWDATHESDKRELADAVTRYMQSRNDSFDGGYGPNWGVGALIVIALGLGCLFIWRGGPTARVVYEAHGDVAIITMRDGALARPRTIELTTPRVRVWKGMIEIHDESGVTISLPARENDPQARGLATVLLRD